MDVNPNRLESIVAQIGEAVLASTDTIERLSDRVDSLAVQVQQQGYQIFALSDVVQNLAENQENTLEKLTQLTETLQRLIAHLESREVPSAQSASGTSQRKLGTIAEIEPVNNDE